MCPNSPGAFTGMGPGGEGTAGSAHTPKKRNTV